MLYDLKSGGTQNNIPRRRRRRRLGNLRPENVVTNQPRKK